MGKVWKRLLVRRRHEATSRSVATVPVAENNVSTEAPVVAAVVEEAPVKAKAPKRSKRKVSKTKK